LLNSQPNLDLNSKDENGSSVYLIAAQNGHVNILQNLEAKGVNKETKSNIGSTALHEAVLGKKLDAVKHFITTKFPLNIKRGDGYTPLALATMNTRDVSIVRALLEAGTDPNLVSKDGVGPMFFAIKTQNVEAIQLLIDFGAEIKYNSPKKIDKSPCFMAIIDESKSFYEISYGDDLASFELD